MAADLSKPRVAFQGDHGAFSEAAAIQLLGDWIVTVPCSTFDAAFRAVPDGAADALLAPIENSLAGSVVRVYDLLLTTELGIVAETILPIEHHVIGMPGATLEGLRSVASHPMALAQCEKFFLAHPELKRVPAEDTAGSVRQVLAVGDKTAAAIAGRRAAEFYSGVILSENVEDDPENFTRFVLLIPVDRSDVCELKASSPAVTDLMVELQVRLAERDASELTLKMSVALRLAHKPGSLVATLEPFARHGVNLLKIESRPIHGSPWEYQFFIDIESPEADRLQSALHEVRAKASDLRILGLYRATRSLPR